MVADHEKVDVAGCPVRSLRYGPEDEGYVDHLPERQQGRADWVDKAHGLQHKALQLLENRRGWVRAVALLIADIRDI
jgi:hypothetical protein